jgi:hypothetical protein
MGAEHYREALTAALLRIEQLEHEIALFRADPSHERVELAEERLEQARGRRRRAQKLLPRALVASLVLTGAFALTDPSLVPMLRGLGYALSAVGALSAMTTILGVIVMAAQGPRPVKFVDLERRVRIAKADVGARREARVRIGDDSTLLPAEAPEDSDGGSRSATA